MKLIEAEKAKDVIHEYFKSLMAKDASGADVYKLAVGIVSCLEHDANLLKAIDELPSAQPDIIRCKDCKFYGRADKRRFYRGSDGLNNRIDTIVPDRDFCSKAERREE